MRSSEREKMCIHCEGRIPFDAAVCPYCASDQSETNVKNSFQAPLFQSQSLEDSLTSLYTPPYQGKRPQFNHSVEANEEEDFEEELFSTSFEKPTYKEVVGKHQEDPLIPESSEKEERGSKSSLWPILFLIAGVNLLILSLMQLLFSKNGFLRLEWNAKYWFLYFLASGLFLFFGYKKFKRFD